MKRIKAFALLLGVVVLASCASQKRVIYLQDTQADEQIKIAQDYQIRIKPLDRLTVVVNSRDPELAAPFNTSTSLNSLTGTPLSTYSSNSASLQIRTVDENGDLDMPIIGPIQCKGKTRSELAQEIADKIREGGYISDPTVNIQFADMKISVIGEVARPGQYDITNDRISLLDALSLAGDLTIYGVRSDVKVIREENGVGVTVSELTCVRFYKSGKTDIYARTVDVFGERNGGRPSYIGGREIRRLSCGRTADRQSVGEGWMLRGTDDHGNPVCFTTYIPFELYTN